MEDVLTKGFSEIKDEELYAVDGGGPLAVLAAVGTVWVVYEVGYAIGKAVAHARS